MNQLQIFTNIVTNVRRYVQLVRQLADGGACFCTRGDVLKVVFRYKVLGYAKTVTSLSECHASAGPAFDPITNLSLGSEVFAAQKAVAYTDPLANVTVLFNVN